MECFRVPISTAVKLALVTYAYLQWRTSLQWSQRASAQLLESTEPLTLISRDGITETRTLPVGHYDVIIGILSRNSSSEDLVALLNENLGGEDFLGSFLVVFLVEGEDDVSAHALQHTYSALLNKGEIFIPTSARSSSRSTNNDVSLLMRIAANRCQHYLHLSEGNFKADKGVMPKIQRFTSELRTDQWISIDFASGHNMGGQLLNCKYIPALLNHFAKQDNTDDLNITFQSFLDTHYPVCDVTRTVISSACKQELGTASIPHRPSLFSSPKGLRDPNIPVGKEPYPWEDVPIYINPKARLSTTMTELDEHTLNAAYEMTGFLLVAPPVAGDVLFVNFTPPVPIEEFFLRSWHSGHPRAHFDQSTVIEVLPLPSPDDVTPNDDAIQFTQVGSFNERGIAEGQLGSRFGKIASVRLRVQGNHQHHALIREMHFKLMVVPTSTKPCCQPYWKNPFR